MSKRSEYKKNHQRQWIAARRSEWFKDKFCAMCGSTQGLELDHIDAKLKTKKTDHCIWSLSASRRDLELTKCQVLCHTCHIDKTVRCLERPHGGTHWNVLLTEDNVREIRTLYSQGDLTMDEIGARYGMDKKNIYNVIRRRTWKHVI